MTNETADSSHLNKVKEMNIPVVIFDKTIPQRQFASVVFDNVKNAELCAEKLINHGCRTILGIFGDENLDITQSRLAAFQNTIKKAENIELHTIFCKSTDSVKQQLNEVLKEHNFDGFFAMSDETLMGLHSSLIKKNLNNSGKKVIAISEGTLPKHLDENYEFIINDGFTMGVFAANELMNTIKGESSNTECYYI